MELLKLAALDQEDLQIVSAYLQDAVVKTGDLVLDPHRKRFTLAANRFVWEKEAARRRFLRPKAHERRRSLLIFDQVLAVKTKGVDRHGADQVLSLLAIDFEAVQVPSGTIVLTFSGEAAVHLTVECIEARLSDLGAAWMTHARPEHDR